MTNRGLACPGAVLIVALSACTGGQTATVAGDGTDSLVSERVTNNEIAGISPPQGVRPDQKRRPEDPIYVNLVPVILDSRIRQDEKPKGAIGQHLRHEFAADPIIQLLPEPKNKIGRKTSQLVPPAADVQVVSIVSLKEILGVRGATGKPSKMLRIIFEATITSQSPPASYLVSDSGPVLQHRAVSKRFAQQIRDVIVDKIGPEIPAR
ncbi:MAG: hypothetical protein HP497_01440 [Nitrospira sp.]|nr:hypothetical protein [Nitrospira sp.]